MVYKTEDTMYGYKAVYVWKKDKGRNSYQLLKVPKSVNIIYAIIKIEIPKGTTIVDPIEQLIDDDWGYHKLRCESAKFVEAIKYCYVYLAEKIDESIANNNILELNFNATIDTQLIEVSKKKIIAYNKSKDIEYCSMYTYGHSLFTNSVILKPNDFMIAEPNLNTNDKIACASGIHFFKTEKEVYNYLLFLNK